MSQTHNPFNNNHYSMIMICIDLEIECMFMVAIVMLVIILNLDGMFPKGTYLGKGGLTLKDPYTNGYLKLTKI